MMELNSTSVSAAVVGASGYAGGELLRLLLQHPRFELKIATSQTYAGKPVSAAWPGLAGFTKLQFTPLNEAIKGCQAVFLAQENGKAMHMAQELLEAGCKVVDLSADFRFRSAELYETWYSAHSTPSLAQSAVYGLPELFAKAIGRASLVGNPGCYPTASILALAPLLMAKAVSPENLIIDAKSGVSGAGRAKFGLDYHYPEVEGSVSAYKIAGTHRHTPEIETVLAEAADMPGLQVSFTPHLMPMTRGILATCYACLNRDYSRTELIEVYQNAYANCPFVTICTDHLPATKHTLGSNACHIGFAADSRTRRITVVSAIDNLTKGAAGQAVQNMNIMFGLPETTGLQIGGLWP